MKIRIKTEVKSFEEIKFTTRTGGIRNTAGIPEVSRQSWEGRREAERTEVVILCRHMGGGNYELPSGKKFRWVYKPGSPEGFDRGTFYNSIKWEEKRLLELTKRWGVNITKGWGGEDWILYRGPANQDVSKHLPSHSREVIVYNTEKWVLSYVVKSAEYIAEVLTYAASR